MSEWWYRRQRYLITVAVIGAVMVCAFHFLFGRYHIGVQFGRSACLPYSVFLIDREDHLLERDAYYAFASHGLQPYFGDGETFVKRLAGLPGDEFLVDLHVYVNGVRQGKLNVLVLQQLGQTVEGAQRHERIPDGKLVMLGSLPLSFDSRYFGFVDQKTLVGRAYPLW